MGVSRSDGGSRGHNSPPKKVAYGLMVPPRAPQVNHLEGSHLLLLRQKGNGLRSDHTAIEHFFKFYWKLTWALERYQAKQCWFQDVSPGEWKPQRGSDWSHLWAKRTKEKKGKTNTDSGKHAKTLSQETLDSRMAMVVEIYRNAHTHMVFWCKLKPMNSRQIYQHQVCPSRSQVEQKPLSKP